MGGMSRTLCLFFGWPLSRSSHHIFIKACAQAHAVDVDDVKTIQTKCSHNSEQNSDDYDDDDGDDDDDDADDDDDVIM